MSLTKQCSLPEEGLSPGADSNPYLQDYLRLLEENERLLARIRQLESEQVAECQNDADESWVPQNHELVEALVRFSPQIVFIFSANGVIKMANDRFLECVDLTRADVINKPLKSITPWIVNERDWERVVTALQDADRIRNLEVRYYPRSGHELNALVSAEKMVLEGEKCILVSMNDITPFERLEQEFLKCKNLHLIGEMAAKIGHEIRNPMTTVRGFLQMFKHEKDWERCRSYLDLMISEIDRANGIISEFIQLSRDKAVYKTVNNLNHLLRSMLVLLEAIAVENGMVVKLDLHDIPDLVFDEAEIRQLILNLVRNGLEAMQPGGMLTLKTYYDNYHRVVLEVIDQGEEIKPEVLRQMGTPFFTTKNGRAGLGLATCISIAERHHAKLSFKSTPRGTTVRVKFKVPPELRPTQS